MCASVQAATTTPPTIQARERRDGAARSGAVSAAASAPRSGHRSSGSMRIDAGLTDAASQEVLWNERYAFDLGARDLFVIDTEQGLLVAQKDHLPDLREAIRKMRERPSQEDPEKSQQ